MEEFKEEEKKKNNNIVIIIICVLLFVVGIVFGLIISNSFSKKSNNEEQNKETTNNTENNTNNNTKNNTNNVDPVDNGTIESVELDSKINELYKKYHSDSNPVQLSGNSIEKRIYESNEYNVTELNNFLPNNYGNKLVQKTINSIEQSGINSLDEYSNKFYSKLEEEFNNFFGKNVKYSKKLFGCYELINSNGKYSYMNNCGDTSPSTAKYNLKKAEKSDKYLYLYEEVSISDNDGGTVNQYNYKWTFELQEDGNYYFLKAERQ